MRKGCLFVILSLVFSAPVSGQDSSVPSFLQSGQDYVMQFSGPSPFQKTVRLTASSDNAERSGGRRARTVAVEVFTVVSRAGGSWVLVEHPKDISDAEKWNAKRLAIASLTPQSVAALQSTEDGQARLEQLRARASVEIATSRTWVNLDHVVAIRKAPIEPSDYDAPALQKATK